MVKKIFYFFLYLCIFFLALIYFSPKEALYHFAEQQLKPFQVILSNETLKDNGFSLVIQNASLSVEKIPSATIHKTTITPLGFYNDISMKNIILSNAIKSFAPTKITDIKIQYTLFQPLFIKLNGEGAFGTFYGTLNLQTRKLHIVMQPSKIMKTKYKTTLRNLKKTKNGVYIYEQNL